MIQACKGGHRYNIWKDVRRDLDWWIQTFVMQEFCIPRMHEKRIHNRDRRCLRLGFHGSVIQHINDTGVDEEVDKKRLHDAVLFV